MLLFYAPEIIGNQYVLPQEEAIHCLKSLRLKVGDEIFLTNGKGILYKAKILTADIKYCQVSILEEIVDYGKLSYSLDIAVAPTKNTERMEWFAEKAVEIGVSNIYTITCENSERAFLKTERIKRVMVAAMKQSLRTFLPTFESNIPFENLLSQYDNENCTKLIAYCGETSQPKILLKDALQKNGKALVLIGPEGDFSEREVNLALAKGFLPITLGSMRLRTETAAMFTCAVTAMVNQ